MSTTPMTAAAASAGRRRRIDSRRRWFPDLGEPLHARQLLVLLSRRDITVKYRQTVLGALWIFVSPVLSAGLFTFVFGQVADLESDGVPYFAFSYAGLVGWNLFADTMTGASRSLTANAGLITKIYFPRLVLPFSTVASALINAGVSLCVMLVLLVAYDIGVSFNLLLLPVWLALSIALAMGIGLVLTSISVAYRDINYLTPAIIPLLLYLTPVAYSVNEVPDNLRTLYRLNPAATIVEGCRWSLLGQGDLTAWAIGYTVAVTLAALALGMMLFARLEWSFADVA